MERIPITWEEAKTFLEREGGMGGWELVCIPDEDEPDVNLVGVVHPHRVSTLKHHLGYLGRKED